MRQKKAMRCNRGMKSLSEKDLELTLNRLKTMILSLMCSELLAQVATLLQLLGKQNSITSPFFFVNSGKLIQW